MRVGHGGLGGRRLRPSGVAKIVFVHLIIFIILLIIFLFVIGGGGVPRLRREDLFIVILFILHFVVLELRFGLGMRLGLRFGLRLPLLRLKRERHRLALLRPFTFRRPRVMSRAELAHAVGLLGVARCRRGGGGGQGCGAVVD